MLTVKELIKRLQELDENLPIRVAISDDAALDIQCVELDDTTGLIVETKNDKELLLLEYAHMYAIIIPMGLNIAPEEE